VFGIGIFELVIIFVVVLLAIGPEKLPQFARSFAKYMGEFRRASDELKRTVMSVGDEFSVPKIDKSTIVGRLSEGLKDQMFADDSSPPSELKKPDSKVKSDG